jgi:uncharacterized protein YbaP (TraB family)
MPKKVKKELSRSLRMIVDSQESRKKALKGIEKRRRTDESESNKKIYAVILFETFASLIMI